MSEDRIINVDSLTMALLVHGAIAAEVSQPTKDAPKKIAKETNRAFARTNKAFLLACEKARIPPTKRQASKFRSRRGLAYQKLRTLASEA